MQTTDFQSLLNIPEGEVGKFSIEHKVMKAGSIMPIVDVRDFIFTGQKPMSFVLSEDRKFTYLKEQGDTWMSDIPKEQYSQDLLIDKFDGTVLIGGLGLGYIAKRLDARRSVKKIVVVEKSKEVVSLVWKYLNLKKAVLIRDDLFEFVKYAHHDNEFDWCYYDIWGRDSESLLYSTIVPLRKASMKFMKYPSRIVCWQEGVIRGQLYHGIENTLLMFKKRILSMSLDELDSAFGGGDKPKLAYWRWYLFTKPSDEDARIKAKSYADTWGEKEWANEWKKWL